MDKISYFAAGLALAFILWFFVSWIDVISDNNAANPKHSEYNAFVVMVELMEKNTETGK